MENPTYQEKLSSNRTEALFMVLALLFLLLFAWRVTTTGPGFFAILFSILSLFFLFYSLNYRTLTVRLESNALILTFGIFTWRIPLDNIESCYLDDKSLWRIGGAGIHATFIRRRYRVFFNFLEYPRAVVVLKEKKGPVREIAFSTRQAESVKQIIEGRIGSI
jgi:hypothetical protein